MPELEINLPDIVAEVTGAFHRYEAALVGNDVAVLDELFWNDPLTIRYGAGENLYGYNQIKAFRQARSAVGLERTLANTVITTFGRDFATANTEFHRGGRIGRQSHSWARLAAGWRIVAAHVSMLAERP
jgi:hypothetical protein